MNSVVIKNAFFNRTCMVPVHVLLKLRQIRFEKSQYPGPGGFLVTM